MSTSIVIILVLSAIALVIAVILAAGAGGPKVTTIERKTERAESQEGEEP